MSPTLIQTTTGSKPVDTNKIMESLIFASKDLSKVDIFKVYQSTVASLHSGITTDEINILTTKAASGYIAEHYEYSYLAARLTLQKLYKEVFGESMYEYEDFYSTRYQEYFDEYLEMGIGYGLLSPELKTFDLNIIKSALVPQRDLVFKEPGMARVYKQYVLKTNNDNQKAFELPQFWLMRVAMGLAVNEKNKEQKAIEFYNLLSTQKLLHSTPTLLNSGRIRNQNSSCFLLTVQDDLHNIYKTYSDIAMLSKYAGGIGVDFTNIRATGALIKGTNGKSLGLIPFIKVLDSSAAAVNQGGVRKGAVAAYLEIWHKDIFDFIATKYVSIDENRRCPNIHTVAWIPDLFMKRLINNEDKWTLFSPSDTTDLHSSYGADFEAKYLAYEADENIPKETISLRKLWEEMLTSLLGKGFGHPWITFKDPSNMMNPQKHVGVVNNSNLCTEILLPTSEDETAVCNLSSINIAHFIKGYEHKSESLTPDKGIFESEVRAHYIAAVELPKSPIAEVQAVIDKINWQDLAETTQIAVRMLDNVIDINFYTTKEAENANTRHRPVGLGIMGMQTLLQKLELAVESEVVTEFNDYLFEFINYNALQSSVNLAKEKGQYSSFVGSDWSMGILPIDNFEKSILERGMTSTTNMDRHLDWESLRSQIKTDGLRNSQVMSIAPTRTISYIAGVSPSIEPWDSNVFTEVGMTGKYMMINDELVDTLERHGFWTPAIISQIKKANGSIQGILEIPVELRNMFKTAWELHPKFLIAQNARRQKWIDMGISFNQWINSTNGSDAERIYIECWKAGLKTTYYLHSKSASQAAKVGLEEEENVIKILPSGAVCDMTDPECEACQ
jgi:ribonucleoside-diphosphate reductase alpha chain